MNDLSFTSDDGDVRTLPSLHTGESYSFTTYSGGEYDAGANGAARAVLEEENAMHKRLGASWDVPPSHRISAGEPTVVTLNDEETGRALEAHRHRLHSSSERKMMKAGDSSVGSSFIFRDSASSSDIISHTQTADLDEPPASVLTDNASSKMGSTASSKMGSSWGNYTLTAPFSTSDEASAGSSLHNVTRRLGALWGDSSSRAEPPTGASRHNTAANSSTSSSAKSDGGNGRISRILKRKELNVNIDNSGTSNDSTRASLSASKMDIVLDKFTAQLAEKNKTSMSGMQWQKTVKPTHDTDEEVSFGFPISVNLSQNESAKGGLKPKKKATRKKDRGDPSVYDGSTITSNGPYTFYHHDVRPTESSEKTALGSKQHKKDTKSKNQNVKRPRWFLISVALLTILIVCAIVGASVCGLGYCTAANNAVDDAVDSSSKSAPSTAADEDIESSTTTESATTTAVPDESAMTTAPDDWGPGLTTLDPGATTTVAPTTSQPTPFPTSKPTTTAPTVAPTRAPITRAPVTLSPTNLPTFFPAKPTNPPCWFICL